MKNQIYPAFVSLLFVLLLCSCGKEEIETVLIDSPAINVETSVSVLTEGGDYRLAYSVENPADDGVLSCSTDVTWLSDISASDGEIRFNASANTEGQIRGGSITVLYTYSGGFCSAKSAVVQASSSAPSLSVQPTGLTAFVEGGVCSFSYSILNPADDGVLSCSSDVDWIGDFDLSEEGAVSFLVERSTSKDLRQGDITLTYSYYYSEISISSTVTVVQDHTAGWDGTLEDIIGTYEATALALTDFDSAGMPVMTETTWTVIVTPFGNTSIYIQGVTPYIAANYLEDPDYYATGTMDEYGYIIVPSQFITGTFPSEAAYAAYTPCVEYDPSGPYLYYDYDAPDCTFAYDRKEEVWVSDYGMWAASYMIPTWKYIYEPFDVTAPRITMRKIGDAETAARRQSEDFSSGRPCGTDIVKYAKAIVYE